jgi:hypothetical protein
MEKIFPKTFFKIYYQIFLNTFANSFEHLFEISTHTFIALLACCIKKKCAPCYGTYRLFTQNM